MQKKPNSICFDCKNAVFGCCWAKRFEPVPGWEAVKTRIKNRNSEDSYYIDSYKVISCPQFKNDNDEVLHELELICKLLNISERTYFRWKKNGLYKASC